MKLHGFFFSLVLGCHAISIPCFAQTGISSPSADYTQTVRSLASRLLWHDESGSKTYALTRDATTQQILQAIDSYVTGSFPTVSTTPDQVRRGVDALLDHKEGDLMHNFAFNAELPAGRFLILGAEIWRGSDALTDDAVSIRAYKAEGGKFALVAATDLGGLNLFGLRAITFPAPPISGESWFLAWAEKPPQAPPTIALRLYAFDGQSFREVWAAPDFLSGTIDNAIGTTADGGFIVNRLVDPTGMAPHSPSIAIHDQYILTANGPLKTGELQELRRD